MSDSGFTEVQTGHLDWSQAARDLAAGFVLVLKFCIGSVGVSTVALVAILLGMPAARQQLVQLVPVALSAPAALSMMSLPAPAPQPSAWDNIRAGRVELAPRDRLVAQYLARRYRVADQAVRMVVAAAREVGTERQVDPLLIMAVIAVESSMNPFAQSPVGAQGLMQVMTTVHGDKFELLPGRLNTLDPVANIKVGGAILGDLIQRGGSVERGLQLYVGAGNLADDGGYASRVLAELGRLKLAAGGNLDAALASGLHAEARAGLAPVASAAPATATDEPRALAVGLGSV